MVECTTGWRNYLSIKRRHLAFFLTKLNIRWARKSNSLNIARRERNLRAPLKVAVDTTVMQIFSNRIVSPEVTWRSWSQRDTAFRHLVNHQSIEKTVDKNPVDSAFAVCEAFRNGDLLPVILDSVSAEMAQARDRHLARYHGPLRIDYKVTYEHVDFLDLIQETREIFRRVAVNPEKISDTQVNMQSKYLDLFKQLSGKSHRKDLIHLVACDIGRIEIFLTHDGKLKNAFDQYQKRENVYRLAVHVFDLNDLCKALSMKPIPLPLASNSD